VNEYNAIVAGNPPACPMTWSRCVREYRVKSGMLSDSVAQYPIIPINAGKNTAQNIPALGPPGTNADGCESIGPNPPAARYAHASSASPSWISSGALMSSRMRIDSMRSEEHTSELQSP